MNIGMILNAPYPSDIRIFKEATALIKAGHKVHLLCITRKNQNPYEIVDGIHVHRIKVATSLYGMAFWDTINAINFVHPLFKKALPSFIKQGNISVLHVHDLPLAGTALAIKQKLNIKVVLDFHENYPEAMKIWFSWKSNPIVRLKNKLFFGYERWLSYERRVSEMADVIIAVVKEMKQRLMDAHKLNPNKITVITNSESKDFANALKSEDIYNESFKGKFIITYTGNIGPHRGVDTAIESLSHLKQHKDIILTIIGSGSNDVMNKLKLLISNLELDDRVFLFGYQPFSKFPAYMSYASVNTIPHHQNPHTDNTIPHKLYQNILSKKPVLVSSSTPLKRVVEETNSGLVFEAGNAEDFAHKVLMIYKNKDLAEKLGANGYQATYFGNHNWEHTQLDLISLYEKLK